MSVRRLRLGDGQVARSLVWDGDRIVDLVGGGASVALDGASKGRQVNWAFAFDRAVASPSGRFGVLYTATATKGLVIERGRAVREIDRSFYCADVYEFPIALGRLADGTEVLAHCPDGYNRLVVERLEDGVRLASATDRAADVFHSRLSISPGGRFLLSAGWLWHPLGIVAVYDVEQAQQGVGQFDGDGLLSWRAVNGEVEAACWLDDDRLVVSTSPDEERLDDESDGLSPGEIGVWSVETGEWVSRHRLGGHTGTLHRCGESVLALYGHPRLIDPFTGTTLAEWPDIATGTQTSSILGHHREPIPPVAVDADRARFAVGDHDQVVVVDTRS